MAEEDAKKMAVIEDGEDGDGPGTRKRRRVGEDGKAEDVDEDSH